MAPAGSRPLLQRIRSRARKITERAGGRKPGAPAGSGLLSLVLVPGQDEDSLLRTVAALLSGDEQDLEIIVAVPGDAPPTGLPALAATDPRLRLLTGTSLEDAFHSSAGAFLTFVEAGAVPVPGLHRALANALESSPAQFVAAIPYQTASPASRNIVRLPEEQRRGLTLLTRPEAFADTAMWTKLYRREFLVRVMGPTPVSDPEFLALRGYLLADGFDYVVTATGRQAGRPTAAGIREELLELAQRARSVAALVSGETHEKTLRSWFGAALGSKWLRFSKEVPWQDESYWDDLGEAAALVLRTPGAVSGFPVHSRILAFLAAGGYLEDFRTVLAELQDNGTGFRLVANPGGEREEIPAYLPLISRAIPAEVLRLPGLPMLRSGLSRFGWTGRILQLGGFAYLEGLDAGREPVTLGLRLVEPRSGSRLQLPAAKHYDPAIDEASGDQLNSYAGAGFLAEIDAATVLAAMGDQSAGEWYVELELSWRGLSVRDRLAVRDTDRVPARFPLGPAIGRCRLTALFDGVLGLRFSVVSYRYLADPPAVNGPTVSLSFRGEAPAGVFLDVPGAASLPFEASPSDPATFSLTVPSALTQIAADAELGCLIRAGKPGAPQPVGAADEAPEVERLEQSGAEVRVAVSGFGFLSLILSPARLQVSGWRTEGTAVVIVLAAGAAGLQRPGDLALVGPETIVADALRAGSDGRTEAVFELARDCWGAGSSLPRVGRYRLVWQQPGREAPIVVSGALAERRAEARMTSLRIVSPARNQGQEFQLQLTSFLKDVERSGYGRRRLIDAYWASVAPLDADAVLFESFGGRSPSDSGLAISNELASRRPGLRRYWSIVDASVPVPEGCVPLLRFSAEWFHVLGTAKYLVNNNDFPVFFRKRRGQVYVQTWHGTPLKRIGFDTPRQRLTPSYLRTLGREPGEWDLLLAQSPFAARQLARAFRYTGPVAVLGYPRNDALRSASAQSVRAEVRDRLCISPADTVVLYAPTWRDNAVDSSGRVQAVSYLKAADAAQLGPGYSLLYRGHHKVLGQRGNPALGMKDVTDYPHVTDLCLAADVLVTDYSSIVFDFAVTGKPIFFLAPDLAQYRDETRGFYFDLQEQAPGPIAENSRQLFDQIRSHRPAQWESKYRTFVETYAPMDDGGATARVCRAVWGDD